MSNADTMYQARFFLPEQLEKGRAETITCPIYFEGSLVVPDSGTVTVKNAQGTALVDAEAVTVSGDVAQYSIGAALADDEAYSEYWLVEWDLVFSGVTKTFINECSLVRYKLAPVVTDADIYRRVPVLDPTAAATISTDANYQNFIEEAWIDLMHAVIQKGNRPNLIMSPSALRMPHMFKTLELIYRDLASVNQPELFEEADRYAELYRESFEGLNFQYDSDEDGLPEKGEQRAMASTVWLVG